MLFSLSVPLYSDDATYVELVQIGRRTWVHKSYETINGYRTDSNGMVVDYPNGIILVDTCWNDTQTQSLLNRIDIQFNKPILLAIITHAHDDRIGGIRTLLRKKIKVVSTPLTKQKAMSAGYPAPQAELDTSVTKLVYDEYTVETYYPGPGHTEDNITVWIPSDRILFGGCLIKSMQAKNLGNIADANVAEW